MTAVIVGTAHVEIKAVTEKVRKEIRDGFQKGMSGVGTDAGEEFDKEMSAEVDKTAAKVKTKLKKSVAQAGDEGGKSFMARLRAKIDAGGGGIGNRLRGLFGRAGDDAGNNFGKRFWSKVESHFKGASLKGKLLAGMTSFIPTLISLVGELSGSVVALASNLTQAAGVLPVMYSNIVPLISVLGGVKLGMSGVGKALHQVMSGTATPAALAKALHGLSPEARRFVSFIKSLKPEITSLKQTASKNLLPGLTTGIREANTLFGPFRKMIGSIDKIVGNTAARLGGLLAGPLKKDMGQIFSRNTVVVRRLAGAFLPLFDILVRVYHAMQPVQMQMAKSLKNTLLWLDGIVRVNEANGKLAGYFQRSWARAKQLGDVLKNVAIIVHNVFKAASQAGNSLMKSLDDVTGRWAKLTGTAKTQNSMRQWFNQTVPVTKEFLGIIGDLIKGVVKLGSSNKDLLPLLHQVREQLVPAILRLLQATTGPVARAMIGLLTTLANILATISGSGTTGFLNSFFTSINQVAQALNTLLNIPGVKQVAGILGGIAGSIAAFGYVAGKLRILTLAKNLVGFGGAAKTAAKGVATLEAAKLAEKEAMVANDAAVVRNVASYGALGGALSKSSAAVKSEGVVIGEAMAANLGGAGLLSKMKGRLKGGLFKAGGLFIGGQIAHDVIGGKPGSTRAGLGSVAQYAGTGAALGSFIGPEGTAIGAGAGAVYGAVKGGLFHTGWSGPSQKSVNATAMSAAGYAKLQAQEEKYNTIASHTSGIVQMAAERIRDSAKAAIDHADKIRQDAIANQNFGKVLFNEKTATNELTAAMNTHIGKVLGVTSSYDSFRQQLNDMPGSIQNNKRLLTGFSNAAIQNRQTFGAAAQAILGHIDAMKQENAPAGAVQRSLLEMSGRLRQQAIDTYGSSAAVDKFLGRLGLLPEKIRRAMAGLHAMGLAAGGDLGRGFVEGIQRMMGASTTAAKYLADQTVKHLRIDSLQARSPSRVTHKVGREFTLGFANGIADMTAHAQRRAHQMATSVVGTINKQASALAGGAGMGQMGTLVRLGGATAGAKPSGPGGGPTSPLIHIDNYHVRSEADITALEQMLYRANDNLQRALGERDVLVDA